MIGGLGTAAGDAAEAFYSTFVEQVHRVSGPREAEMAKLLENTYRHVNIALVNEMAIFCEELGIDLWESIGAASTKPFGFAPFSPGPGVGGHCIPVDPSYLSWRVRRLGYPFRFVELAAEINDRMPSYVASRVAALLNDERKAVAGSRILVLGVAYKRDVGDMRESSAPILIRRLESRGADVRWHDPHVPTQAFADTSAVAVEGELSAEELGCRRSGRRAHRPLGVRPGDDRPAQQEGLRHPQPDRAPPRAARRPTLTAGDLAGPGQASGSASWSRCATEAAGCAASRPSSAPTSARS